MAWWTNQMPSCYMSWAREPESCCTLTSGAPLDFLSPSHTWCAAVPSPVMPNWFISLSNKSSLLFKGFHRILSSFPCDLEHVVSGSEMVCCVVLGDQEGRLDLSHPVHVDNCLLEPETKQCWREPPAFTHRDLRYTNITWEERAGKTTRTTGKWEFVKLGRENREIFKFQVWIFLLCLLCSRVTWTRPCLTSLTAPFSTWTTTLTEESCSSLTGMRRPWQ